MVQKAKRLFSGTIQKTIQANVYSSSFSGIIRKPNATPYFKYCAVLCKKMSDLNAV